MNYSLESLYNQVQKLIHSLDFEAIWHGFKPYKFALYNDKECFYDGKYIEKPSEFCANTSVLYNGERIAIWWVRGEIGVVELTSKMVHEMFHAFQDEQGWNYFSTNELEALYKYKYDAENLSIKLHENKLLLELNDEFDKDKYNELLSLRKYRMNKFPYEFAYEIAGEEIEGSANYVEWKVLEQLDKDCSNRLVTNMHKVMLEPDYFFPIRIAGYYTGALLINAMIKANDYHYGPKKRPIINHLLESNLNESVSINKEQFELVTKSIKSFNDESKKIIDKAIQNNEIILTGPYKLLGVNVYNARCYQDYIISYMILMYEENNDNKTLYGNFVIKMSDEQIIDKVYKLV